MMDNVGQIIANETYLLSETKLVTAEKRVIPSSMPGLQANRGPMAEHPLSETKLVTAEKKVIPLSMPGLQANRESMAEHPLLETNMLVTTKKELMIQDGHMPRAKLETMIEEFS